MTVMTPETQSRIAILRSKISENTATMEEMQEVVRLVRGDRRNAQAASDGARRKKAAVLVPSADDLLDEMGGL